jgi:hypothetical protein
VLRVRDVDIVTWSVEKNSSHVSCHMDSDVHNKRPLCVRVVKLECCEDQKKTLNADLCLPTRSSSSADRVSSDADSESSSVLMVSAATGVAVPPTLVCPLLHLSLLALPLAVTRHELRRRGPDVVDGEPSEGGVFNATTARLQITPTTI